MFECILAKTLVLYFEIRTSNHLIWLIFVGKVYRDIVGSAYYVAPEVLHRNYGKEIDVWSAGVMLYILLSGVPPFWGETEKTIFEAILEGKLDLETSPWPTISESAKDLIRKMLIRDPKKRITAAEALGMLAMCINLLHILPPAPKSLLTNLLLWIFIGKNRASMDDRHQNF